MSDVGARLDRAAQQTEELAVWLHWQFGDGGRWPQADQAHWRALAQTTTRRRAAAPWWLRWLL